MLVRRRLSIPERRNLTFLESQIRFAICAGIPPPIAAEVLGVQIQTYTDYRMRLIRAYGFDTPLEFAVNVNAAVRNAAYGQNGH